MIKQQDSHSEPEFVKMATSHPRNRFRGKSKKITEGNSVALINDFPFDLKDYLNKPKSIKDE